jgi:hypothetical protein
VALPGETSCRPLADCGEPPYGPVAVSAGAVHVDASYLLPDSDGSAARPFRTVQQGVDAAPAAGQVVIAAGTYAESVTLVDKELTLQGRCADLVELVGSGAAPALSVTGAASGRSVISGLGLSGPGAGLALTRTRVAATGLRVHDTGGPGVTSESSELTLSGSLVEQATGAGVRMLGGTGTLRQLVVRGTRDLGDPLVDNAGLALLQALDGELAELSLEAVVVEDGIGAGLHSLGARDRRDLRVDDGHRHDLGFAGAPIRLLDAGDEDPHAFVHLRTGQPDAVILAHRLDHVVDQFLHRRRRDVFRIEGLGLGPQDRVAKARHFQDRHVERIILAACAAPRGNGHIPLLSDVRRPAGVAFAQGGRP